jgi:hypothetical protein
MFVTNTENNSEVLKSAAQALIEHVYKLRNEVRNHMAKTLKVDQSEDMSEQDFFIALGEYSAITGQLETVLKQAGFTDKISKAWLAQKDPPLPQFRRPTARMLFDIVFDNYVDKRLFHEIQDLLMEEDRSKIRKESLTKQINTLDAYRELSNRVKKALIDEELDTVGALVSKTKAELARIPNIGANSLSEIISFTQSLGFAQGELTNSEEEYWDEVKYDFN